MDIPYGLYSGTSLGGSTRGILEGVSGSGPVTTTIADHIRTGDISLFKDKYISKGIQEMSILQKDKSLKNNSLSIDKNISSVDNSPSKDKLFSKGENSDDILFFQRKKQKTVS